MATYDEIARRIRTDGNEEPNSPAARDLASVLQTDIIEAVNAIAARTDCFAPQFVTDLVADQSIYCAPDYYKLKAMMVLDATGTYLPLSVQSVGMADRFTGGDFRNDESADPPRYAFYRGQSEYVLDPPPSVSRSSGIVMEGFAKPGNVWKYDPDTGAAIALAGSHECPLPAWAQDEDIITDKVLSVRLPRYAMKEKDASMRALMLNEAARRDALYREKVGRVEAMAALYFQRSAQVGFRTRYTVHLGPVPR